MTESTEACIIDGPEILRDVLLEIQNETDSGCVNAKKKAIVTYMLENPSEEFRDCLSNVIKSTIVRSSVYSQLQCMHCVKNLYEVLGGSERYELMMNSLAGSLSDELQDRKVIGMVLFRLCTKYLEKVLAKTVAKQMKRAEHTFAPLQSSDVQQEELEDFQKFVSVFLCIVYRFGSQCNNVMWKMRMRCMRSQFIDDCEEDSDMFEPASSSLQGNSNLSLSTNVLFFFVSLENMIRSALSSAVICSVDDILKSVTSDNGQYILDKWYLLTSGYLSESQSHKFMVYIVKNYSVKSIKAEIDRKKKADESGKLLPKVALRTGLKKN